MKILELKNNLSLVNLILPKILLDQCLLSLLMGC